MKKDFKIFQILYTIFAGSLLILIYAFIFDFSSATGEMSGDFSRGITATIIDIIEDIFSINLPFNDTKEQIETMNHYIRKTGHFLEYASLGFFAYSIVLCWKKGSKKGIAGVIFLIFSLAALDEIHQYFVPGRYARFTDVLIDALGGMAGIMVIIGIVKWMKKRNYKKAGTAFPE